MKSVWRLLLLTLSLASPVLAAPDEAPEPAKKVHIGLFVIDVHHINDVERSALVDFVILVAWHDKTQVGRFKVPTVVPQHSIWNPEVGVFNNRDLRPQRVDDLTVYPNGKVTRTQRYLGTIGTRFDLSNFPFDHHELLFELASTKDTGVEFEITPQLTGQKEAFSVSGWTCKQGEATLFKHELLHLRLPGLRYSLPIRRLWSHYIWNVVMPLSLVVLMALTSLWIRPKYVAPRIGVAATSMLTVITYRFALASEVPALDYLTRLDLFLLAATALVLLTLVIAVLATRWEEERAHRLDRRCRVALPALFLASSALTLLA